MTADETSLAALYTAACSSDSSAAIPLLESCRSLVYRASLFSPNESVDDIATRDLSLILVDFRLAELLYNSSSLDRKHTLTRCLALFGSFVSLCEDYAIGDISESSTPLTPAARRTEKIRRYKEQQTLKQQLEHLGSPTDDSLLRKSTLLSIKLAFSQATENMESISDELNLLENIPPQISPPQNSRRDSSHSDRLDSSPGYLLDKDGKPTQPFTITNSRLDIQKTIFRPSHRLPTMSIDEYLANEIARGNILTNQGPPQPAVDEDDIAQADAATYKARQWDEFKEANPRGSGPPGSFKPPPPKNSLRPLLGIMVNSSPIVKQTRSSYRIIHRCLSSWGAQPVKQFTFSHPPDNQGSKVNSTSFAVHKTPNSLRKSFENSLFVPQTPTFGSGGYVQQMLLSKCTTARLSPAQNVKILANDETFPSSLERSPPCEPKTPLLPDHPFTQFHLLVGEITSCQVHPSAERLYIHKVKLSCATKNDRTIISGLRTFFPNADSLIGQKCIVVANIPKRKIRGIWSEGMLLCGTKKTDTGNLVELLRPPADAKPGERIVLPGQTVSSNPTDVVKSKSELKKIEKIWEEVVGGFGVDTRGHGVYLGRPLHVIGKGPCVCESIKCGSLY